MAAMKSLLKTSSPITSLSASPELGCLGRIRWPGAWLSISLPGKRFLCLNDFKFVSEASYLGLRLFGDFSTKVFEVL